MTIGGFIVDGGRALMWCDSEKYTDTEPDGEFSKLAVQALGPIAATGCGTVAMLMQVVEDLHRVRSIDGAASILKKTKRTDGGEIGAVGYSPRYLRMLGYHFSGENGSAGQLCPHAAWPKVDATSLHAVGERRDLVGIALGQMTTLRRLTNRLASGHTLVVAELTRHAIAIERIPDFGAMAAAINLSASFRSDDLSPVAGEMKLTGDAERLAAAAVPRAFDTHKV